MPDGSLRPTLRPAALHAALLAADSATAVLEALCGHAVRVRRLSPDRTDGAAPRAELGVGEDETVIRRHVRLLGGATILSEARLWYMPALLPTSLRDRLANTAEPFGRVVRSLGLRRTTLAARLCETDAPFALEHRAILADSSGQKVALVQEHYGWDIFAGS